MVTVHESGQADIKVLNDVLFLVRGKLFTFSKGVLDLSDPEHVKFLVGLADEVYTPGSFVQPVGDMGTVCLVCHALPDKPDARTVYPYSIESLNDECLALAKGALGIS